MKDILPLLKQNSIIKDVVALSRHMGIKPYLVGGYIRDLLLDRKREQVDMDFAFRKDSLKLAMEFADRIKGSFVALDKKRGVARIIFDKEGIHYEVDFADFRAKNIEQDLMWRDFTVNALAIYIDDLDKDKSINDVFLDPAGGLKDLEQKIIKIASSRSFSDDPLRIIRAYSLSGALGFEIDRDTLESAKKHKGMLTSVAGERITEELFEILDTKDSYKVLSLLDEAGILEIILPEIKPMRGVTQGPYHHLDVWKHSLETVKKLESLLEELLPEGSELSQDLKEYVKHILAGRRKRLGSLKLAALLHDIAKPITRTEDEDGKIRFIGHEKTGADIVNDIGKRLKLSSDEIECMKRITLHHLRPGYLVESGEITKRALLRLFRDTDIDGIGVLLISAADKLATKGPLCTQETRDRHVETVLNIIKDYYAKKEEVAKPPKLLTGDDLIRELGLKPGPQIGEILREIEEAQVEGEIKTKEEALKLAKSKLKKGDL